MKLSTRRLSFPLAETRLLLFFSLVGVFRGMSYLVLSKCQPSRTFYFGSIVIIYKFILNLQLDVGKVVEVILVALKASLQSGVGALVAGVVHRVQLRMIS